MALEPAEADDADQPAEGRRRGEGSVADGAHVQMLGRVEDEDAPGSRPRHVEDEDDQHERPHGGVAAQPVQALADRMRLRRPATGSFGGIGVRAIREMRTTARLTQRICTRNGQNDPIAKRNAPSGGPAS